ncbi:hypothetical protein V5799_023269 [Amblyomma americanum]|uniref:Uncharacterized protein n=1 Tax=Amblyomma americanum TaxID=6943 RepID=A0AAQ4FJR7_AMBAM
MSNIQQRSTVVLLLREHLLPNNVLRGVDGIITNDPRRMARIMKEREFRNKLRPATIQDNPGICVPGRPAPRSVASQQLLEIDFLGDFNNSANGILHV